MEEETCRIQVDKILTSYRLLEFSNVRTTFDEIEAALGGNTIAQKYVDKITAVILPIYYPGDNSPTRLRFSIQCLSCSYLIKIAPDTRPVILTSIIEIFQHFPHIFVGKTPMKRVLTDFIEFTPNYWELINNESKNLSNDITWCFLLFCLDNIESSRRENNWDLILRLLTEPNLIKSRKIREIISFLRKSFEEWGPNPLISSSLLEHCLNLCINCDIPNFLFDPNSCAISLEEQVLETISKHISLQSPKTARSLSLIMRHEGQFRSSLFQISLYLAILRTVPSNFTNAVVQKINNFVEKSTNSIPEKVAAHIVASVSLCNIHGFSMINNFYDLYSNHEEKRSLFFAYLAECADCLDMRITAPLLVDSLNSVAISGASFGVCRFISSLLNKCRLHPEILTANEILNMSQYIDAIISLTNQKCASAVNNTSTDITNMINLTAKVVSKLAIICSKPLNISLKSNNICQLMFSCACCAFTVTYAPSLIIPLEVICCSYIISIFRGFEKYTKLFDSHVRRLTNTVEFPPNGYIFSDETSNMILEVSKTTFRNKTCDFDVFYSTIINYIPLIPNTLLVKEFIKQFWNERTSDIIPTETIRILLEHHHNYDDFTNLFVSLLKNNYKELLKQISHHFIEPLFRHWFISKILAVYALSIPQAFKISLSMNISPTEFKMFIPALKNSLPHHQPGPTVLRAASIKFIGGYLNYNQELTKYCIELATKILLQKKDFPDFPNLSEIEYSFFCDSTNQNINEVRFTNDNKNAETLELEASLDILTHSIQCKSDLISDFELDRIHRSLYRSKDPKVRRTYLNFLSSLGLRGIAYATMVSSNITITPYF